MSVSSTYRLFGALALVMTLASQVRAQKEDAYDAFNRFCLKYFDASKEPEVYRTFGEDVKFLEGGAWRYVSETSACIAFETNLPTRSAVAFGTTTRYGKSTAQPDRHHFLHVHYLRGLKPVTTYHYRMTCVDARGKTVTSKDLTFTTKRLAGAVRIPGDLQGPPYMCDKANTTYLLTEDVVSDSAGINIVADGVTLDFGGHTIVYDDKAGAEDPTPNKRIYGWFAVQGPCGLRTSDHVGNLKVVNGTIRQGRGRGASRPAAYNPIFMRRPHHTELAGVTVEYAGSQITGIMIDSAADGVRVHHNVIVDRGTELYNRHRGLDGIKFNAEKNTEVLRCDHNLIKRTRHRGIAASSNTELDSNEIYIDSFATNSCGIIYYNNRGAQNLKMRRNRIYGTGYHPIGIGSGQGWSDVVVAENYIQMQGVAREERWKGGQGGGYQGTTGPQGFHPVNAIRLQRPRKNIVHENNTIVVKGRGKDCLMRGLWMVPDDKAGQGLVFRNNRIKLIAEDDKAEGYAVSCGGAKHHGDPPVLLEKNTVISNLLNVRFCDNYSHGGKYRFVGNRFVKVGSDARYQTILMGFREYKYPSFGHVFVDSSFEGGASYDLASFVGARAAQFDFSVGWTLDIKGTPGTMVQINDSEGTEAFSGNIPASGKLAVPLLQYRRSADGKTMLTPHTVTAGARRQDVTMDRAKSIDLTP